ncbi:MAG: hypothetical protein ACI4GZ_04235 [Ruminococcus sp.]
MKNITKVILAVVLCVLTAFSFTACKKAENGGKPSINANNPTGYTDIHGNALPAPSDNDEEGWFSVEVLAEYGAMSFTLPKGTTVVTKPQREALYLSGDKKALQTTADYAFASIYASIRKVYIPVFTIGDDGVAAISSLKKIDTFESSTLYPDTDVTSVSFIYKMSKSVVLECSVSLETSAEGEELVYVAFSDKSEEYLSLF